MSENNLRILDVRAQMPNYSFYKDWERTGEIEGIAVHHSATANPQTGYPVGDALAFSNYHVNGLGWSHGAYHYVILPDGTIQYALDEKIPGYHAGFRDPENRYNLEYGQYWNNHYLAVCMVGWFSSQRTWRDSQGNIHTYPEAYTQPLPAQWNALIELLLHLMDKYGIPPENVRGHRELTGTRTECPGTNVDPNQIRAILRARLAPPQTTVTDMSLPPEGGHVLVFWSHEGRWPESLFDAARPYIARFLPDITFHPSRVPGRWRYATILGGTEGVSAQEEEAMRQAGVLVERIQTNNEIEMRGMLEEMARQGRRFLTLTVEQPQQPSAGTPTIERIYTVRSGDTLSGIAKQIYGDASRWPEIFEANRDIISDPGLIRPGMRLRIP